MSLTPPSLSTVLVGGDSLLMECGDRLLENGHGIVAVAASSDRVAEWARQRGLRTVDARGPVEGWAGELAADAFDWLLSITYLDILPDVVLALPRRGAVNFHDGPLPRYGGLNAPVWALLEGAPTYGVSWHMITSQVDAGDLLATSTFDIAPGETSLSLNTRNFEAALESFDGLVDQLARGELRPMPQDPTVERRTFRRADRPAAGQVLDWSQPTEQLDRLVRALTFGPYPNPVGVAKVWTPSDVLLVTEAAAAEGSGPAGRVLSIDDDRIVVATADGALALTALASLVGRPVAAADAARVLGIGVGDDLPVTPGEVATALTEVVARAARHERTHLELLESLTATELPWAATAGPDHEPRRATLGLDLDTTADDAQVVGAFGTVLARLSGRDSIDLALATSDDDHDLPAPLDSLRAPAGPLRLAVDPEATVEAVTASTRAALDAGVRRGPHLTDLVARHPHLAATELADGRLVPLAVRLDTAGDLLPGSVAELCRTEQGWSIAYDAALLAEEDARLLATCLTNVVRAAPEARVAEVDLLGEPLRAEVLDAWNDTERPLDAVCVHDLVHERAATQPDVDAVVFEGATLTYRELTDAANRLAHHLVDLGVRPGDLVGVHVDRRLDLVVAVLGVHTAGGAYVPLDPEYPADRLAHMISDSGCRVILTTPAAGSPPVADAGDVTIVDLEASAPSIAQRPTERPDVAVSPSDVAYCIYTSGSTGLPKGVLVEHGNVVNFFLGMDDVVDHELPATWLAVTSLSFDISVLELLYTLSRGFTVVVYRDRDREDHAAAAPHLQRPMDFSLFYFSGDAEEGHGSARYRLLLEGARFADAHGFRAVWTPERHFHAFGGLYPQPAVSSAAVAAITENVEIRAGSVVMPLTDPIRVAEAWSIVDNISDGRVGISFASGWQPNDFVLKPENFANAKQAMFDGIADVQALWRGETRTFPGPMGPVEVATLPRPVQAELPTWVTTAGNPETYIQAGRIGANVLTHLLGQSVEQLGPKLELYRQARAEAGHDPDAGVVTVMLHTFVGDDDDEVREAVREPLKEYLGTSFNLLREYAWSFPAFQRPGSDPDPSDLTDDAFENLAPDELDAVLEFAFDRYYTTSGLLGSPDRCLDMVGRLKAIGVDEIACLIDFGVDTEDVLASLPLLDEIQKAANPPAPATADGAAQVDQSFAAQVERHGITHFQCTPSMARMLAMHDASRAALATIDNIYIGGEAFPVALARDLLELAPSSTITNMYGPTETTIWSTTWQLQPGLASIPIGEPIANTSVYVLDAHLNPLPPGVPGELWIGGLGVVRGYHERPELTEERFVPDPFAGGSRRMYRTGDLVRWRRRDDGGAHLEFLGRLDHQVKIRGYRIELGEIETQLGRLPEVRECVAVVQDDAEGEQQLVAFASSRPGASIDPSAVKSALRARLPEVMVPAHVVVMDDLPHTPNGKIDRNALPSFMDAVASGRREAPAVAAADDLERTVLDVWQDTLGRQDIGVEDNFFDVGGHSLLVVRMHRRLVDRLERDISLTDLYRFPTVRGFASSLGNDTTAETIRSSVDRAERRKQSLQRRRTRT